MVTSSLTCIHGQVTKHTTVKLAIVMLGGVDALVPFNNKHGDVIAQKEERYFNLYSVIKDKGTADQCLYMDSIASDCDSL